MVTKLWIKILKTNNFSLRKSSVIALTPQLNSTEAHTHAHKSHSKANATLFRLDTKA
jgi:hypothetical protein